MVKQIWALTRKDLKLWLQEPAQWLGVLLTPILFIAILGQVFGSSGTPTMTILAVNEDTGRAGKQVIELLDREKTLVLEPVASRAEADQRVGRGERMAALVIPAGFSAALLTDAGGQLLIIVDPARQQQAGLVVGQVRAATASLLIDAEVTRGVSNAFARGMALLDVTGDRIITTTLDVNDLQKFVTAALKGVVASQVQDAMDAPLVAVERAAINVTDPSLVPPSLFDHLTPGYALFFAFFLMGDMAEVIWKERLSGAFRRLLTTPAPRWVLVLGKVLPYLVIVVVQMLAVFGISTLLFDFDLGESFVALGLMVGTIATTLVGMGIMLATLIRSEAQLGSLPNLINLSFAVISGAMFPSIRIAGLEQLTPHYWAIAGLQDIFARNRGVAAILPEVGVLLTMAVIFFAVGIWRFKFE
ncbi:MAG: ABC-2 transporter permease [Caldilinea sp. CFX5]|nr:ABC-2 transporter permease [Caldilinea sp. CFX5]